MKDAFGVERVSKIAMMPVYHGTSPAGATKLIRHIKSQTPSTSSFKFATGKPRSDGTRGNPHDTRPEGLYTTHDEPYAERYALTGRSPDRGGMKEGEKRGKVLMFNAVGVKPKFVGDNEKVYDPRELGRPLSVRNVKQSKKGKKAMRERKPPNAAANRRAVLTDTRTGDDFPSAFHTQW